MLARLAIPLVLYALLYFFRCWILARAERRAEQAADEPEPPAEQPPTEPPQELPAAA
jgi:hypothetical protein